MHEILSAVINYFIVPIGGAALVLLLIDIGHKRYLKHKKDKADKNNIED